MITVNSQLANLSSVIFNFIGRNGDQNPQDPQVEPVWQNPPQTSSDQDNQMDESEPSEEDDPLEATVMMEPMRSLTRREEAARLREEGHRRGQAQAAGPPVLGDPIQMGHCSEAQAVILYES